LGCELALAGITPVVLEQRPEPSALPKANGLVGQIVDLLGRRGLLDRIRAASGYVGPLPSFRFGSVPLALRRLPATPLRGALIPRPGLERSLGGRASGLGVVVRRGCEVTGLAQDEDGVALEVRGPGGPEPVRARFVVGCDGAQSRIRALAGIGFP